MEKLNNIMLIEDNEDIREIAQIALEEIGGFHLTLCSSGKEALDILQTQLPQLILLDVMMPDMDGPTTLKKIQLLNYKIPVIFMTARVQSHEIEEYLKIGAVGVISKPFNPATLSAEVLKLWDQPSSRASA